MLGVFADDARGNAVGVLVAGGAYAANRRDGGQGVQPRERRVQGELRVSRRSGLCNDMAVAPDGTIYVTDTTGARMLRLKKGAAALDAWAADPLLGAVDGIAVLADGSVYVNTFTTGTLVRDDGEGGRLGGPDHEARNVAAAGPARRHAIGWQQHDADWSKATVVSTR